MSPKSERPHKSFVKDNQIPELPIIEAEDLKMSSEQEKSSWSESLEDQGD